MAINKLMKAALAALSYPDLDIKKNYKVDRVLTNLTHLPVKLGYTMWDHKVLAGGYEIPVRVFLPKEEKSRQLILYFHGGGWVTGNIDSYTNVCAVLSNHTGRRVVSVDYRLAPEYPFPYAPEDCYLVTKEIMLHQPLFDVSPEQIVLMGDSAGGNLAAVVSLMAADRKEFSVQKQILLYPATYNDHSESSPYRSVEENGTGYLLTSKRVCDYMDLYLENPLDFYNPYFAPLLASNLAGQPDTLIITAEYDPLRDEGEAYGEKLRAAGNRVEVHRLKDALHGFISLPIRYTHVKQAYGLIDSFLNEVTSSEQ